MQIKKLLQKGLKDMRIENKAAVLTEKPYDDFEYPYGLQITLNQDVLKKLGLRAADFNVGDGVCLECKADVIAIRASAGRHMETECVELQITDLMFEEEEKPDGN